MVRGEHSPISPGSFRTGVLAPLCRIMGGVLSARRGRDSNNIDGRFSPTGFYALSMDSVLLYRVY
ncbi:hypothetical protein LZ32DRAFT_600079, partial [Colletotrichum eremochloae]